MKHIDYHLSFSKAIQKLAHTFLNDTTPSDNKVRTNHDKASKSLVVRCTAILFLNCGIHNNRT